MGEEEHMQLKNNSQSTFQKLLDIIPLLKCTLLPVCITVMGSSSGNYILPPHEF